MAYIPPTSFFFDLLGCHFQASPTFPSTSLLAKGEITPSFFSPATSSIPLFFLAASP